MRIPWIRSARYAPVALLGLALLVGPGPLCAQPVEIPPTWGGDLWSRPRLTSSWFGLRDALGQKGVVFDVDLLLTPQGVATGGRDTGAAFWGNADYTLTVDTGTLGLWPGGFLKVWADSGFGSNVFQDAGAIVPVNTPALLPAPDDQTTALVNATFTQFLSPTFGLFAGKVGTLDLMTGEFAGNYRTQFLNTGLAFPMNLAMVPVSAYGGGLIVLPWECLALSAMALDPSGTPTNNNLSEAFEDGVMVLASAQATITPFARVGHQSVGYMWSNKERRALSQDPANLARALLTERFPRLADPGPVLHRILERFFPQLLVPVQPPNTKRRTWAMYYTFDQYVWQPAGDPKRGVGLYFTFGASDGDPNPIQYFYNLGIGGNGVVPGRPQDNFGIGWARTQFSGDFVPLLRQTLGLGLTVENAIELYYNTAVTPWLNATLDLQIVNPGLKKTLDASGTLRDVTTTVVPGLRLYVRF
jgi:porin